MQRAPAAKLARTGRNAVSEERGAALPAEGARPLWASTWLQADALEALAELNEQCLELLAEQAVARTARPRPAVLRELEGLWCALDTGARRRASRCPFLLVDPGFTRVGRRPWGSDGRIHDRDWPQTPSAFFTVQRTVPVTRLVLAYVWHLARSDSAAARLFAGLSTACTEQVAARTLRQVIQLAENEPGLLRPRWEDRVHIWRDLLVAAKSGEATALEGFRMRGLQLLAADLRADGAF